MKKNIWLLFIIIAVFILALSGCNHAYRLAFSQDEFSIISGIEYVPDIVIRPKNQEYELVSSNITIAKIIDNKIISIKEGKTEITVRSGKLSDTAILYVDDEVDMIDTEIKYAETVTINFVITNYELANLENENFDVPITVIKNDYADITYNPYLKGYKFDCWYLDRACTKKFIDSETKMESDLTLYAKITERETSYGINNGIVTGLVYDNLSHPILDLPEIDSQGEEVIGIKDNAFMGDTTITKVNIPCTYKTIGDNAFAGCKNLEEINFIGGDSQLEVIGVNAFGVTFDEQKEEKDSCEKLTTLNLPDSIYEIGGYAFYKCNKLSLYDIPSSLTVVKDFAFAYTKINNIDFENIVEIRESAFSNCINLDNVNNTHNVVKCEKNAFENTAIIKNEYSEFEKDNYNGEKAVFYADTIAIGTSQSYGTGNGDGSLILNDNATLIADEAFKGAMLKELTVYLTTDLANNVLLEDKYDFIGENIFYDTIGNHIVVPENLESEYKQKYQYLESHIGYLVAENIETEVNQGLHKVWISNSDNGKIAHYLKYEGEDNNINLGLLAETFGISKWNRICTLAFSDNNTVSYLDLGKVDSLAIFAITSSMKKLVSVYLTSCINPPELESDFSIRFEKDYAKIYVNSDDLSNYRSKWNDNITIKSYLVGMD